MFSWKSFISIASLAAIGLLSSAGTIHAGDPRNEFIPAALTDIKIEEHLEAKIPPGMYFTDDEGEAVAVDQLFDGKVPAIISMNYSNCPMLCVLQLNGLINSLREIDLVAGRDYKIISVSLDPEETPEKAAATKQRYLDSYEKEADPSGWKFLTGSETSIALMAETLGIDYVYLPKKKEYSHPAVFCVCTPEGVISRYHYGIEFPPQTLRLSLVEASEGKIGTTLDRFLLICFHYDEKEGRYAPTARNIMKLGGAVTIGCVGLIFWACHHRRRRWLEETPELKVAS